MGPRRATRALENSLRRWGFCRIAGVDEAGRGSLAGPVFAAAVVLDPRRHVPGLRDSKLLTAAARQRLYEVIVSTSAAWAVAWADPGEIDRINIHQASLTAMRRAITQIVPLPDFVLADGFAIAGLMMAQRAVVGGDRVSSTIAAASILAKVTRDRAMVALHEADPRYGFDRHKGYATAEHLAAVARHGYSDAHRRSFRPPTLFDTMSEPS